MSFTIESLLEDPLLRTRLVAGDAGRGRVVTWAHTCEVEDPWNWLGGGELLMTDGYSFPADPAGQVRFIRELARAGLAGLALGEGFVAPPLTGQARAVADELGFPVLQTARSVPFVTIARAVAQTHRNQGSLRASGVLRLYDILRRTHGSEATDELLDRCAAELKADLHVIELGHGHDLLPTSYRLADSVRQAALARAREQGGRLSAFNRLQVDETSTLLVPVGSRDAAALVLRARTPGDTPDLVLAQHAAMIAELDVERRRADAARRRARGTALIHRMLDGSIDPELAAAQLRSHSLGTGPWTVMVWREAAVAGPALGATAGPGEPANGPLVEALSFVRWPHLDALVGETQLLVVEQSRFAQGLGLDEIDATVGASQPLSAAARFADAVREARWALESARAAGVRLAVYGAYGSSFMPNTVAEGEVAVRRLLGPILDYDEAHDAHLIESLEVFFEVNRSWKAGAQRLRIHKQTLAYRIKKVEELIGTDLRDFGVQAELFLALRTLRLLDAR
jgi:purine catabolism regulator